MNVNFQDFDRVQFRLAQAEDDIKRLLARVTALEGGTPLPPEPEVEIVPTVAAPAPTSEQPKPQPPEPPADVELNILSGAGLTTGSRR